MGDIVGLLPQLAALIEKGGVVGVLLIVCGALVYEIRRSRRIIHDKNGELFNVYGQRDRALLMVVKLRTVCEANKIMVDLTDVRDLLPSVSAPVSSA